MKFYRVLVTGGSGFIGTNLIEYLRTQLHISFASLDLVPPKLDSHRKYWQNVDVRDYRALTSALHTFRPDAVIHLAARTDLSGRNIADYSSNIDGTARMLEALDALCFSGPTIFTSSMYVCRPGYRPSSETDYCPHTIYGESKVIAEQIVRNANPRHPWVIARPTSIWGPWFGIPYADFFNVVLSKRYLHIGDDRTAKTYGFVGNTVEQFLALLSNIESVNGRAVYLGDWPPYIIQEWADEIAAFVPYEVRHVPWTVFKGLALLGDALQLIGLRFPMTSFRLRNMTTNNVHDLTPLREIMGETLPFSRAEGNKATIDWIKSR